MIKTKIYNLKGESEADLNLDPTVFAVESKENLLTQNIRVLEANQRHSYAHTKTRGEVSGGGKKPFKQKGTGNARAGSTRSPLWSGGGVTFGPRNVRNYKLRLPKKMRSQGLKMVLSEKAKDKKLVVLKDLNLAKPSTKQIYGILEKLPIDEGKILLVLPKIDVNIELSVANVPYIKTVKVDSLNVLDILKNDYILMPVESIKKIEEIYKG
jgi:large subunit ribosomal protein L4